jgi:deoxycytidine triphosphate deaminase
MTTFGDFNVYDQIGPASLDFRLGNTFKIYRKSRQTVIDSKV